MGRGRSLSCWGGCRLWYPLAPFHPLNHALLSLYQLQQQVVLLLVNLGLARLGVWV